MEGGTPATPRQPETRGARPCMRRNIFSMGKMPIGPGAKMAVLPLQAELATPCRESFPTAKSGLIMASHSQFRRSVRRDVEAGTPRQSGATTTPTNHPKK